MMWLSGKSSRASRPRPHRRSATQPEASVSGRVEGQILRGSLQQKRKDEGPKDSMSFEEAVVAAIDFHGALTGTGSYAPPAEARGGKHKGGWSWAFSCLFLLRASGRGER